MYISKDKQVGVLNKEALSSLCRRVASLPRGSTEILAVPFLKTMGSLLISLAFQKKEKSALRMLRTS